MPQPDGADMSHRASANEEHADQSQALNPPNPFVPTFGEGPGMQAAPVQGNEISRGSHLAAPGRLLQPQPTNPVLSTVRFAQNYPQQLSPVLYFVQNINGTPVWMPQEYPWPAFWPWCPTYTVASPSPVPLPVSETSQNAPNATSTPAVPDERDEEHLSNSSVRETLFKSFETATGSWDTLLTADNFHKALDSFFQSTLGVQGPGPEYSKTVLQLIDSSGDETVSFTEFRNAAPQLVAVGAF